MAMLVISMISDKIFKWTNHSRLKKRVVDLLLLHGGHVQPIENIGNRGVFDLNYCHDGCECWIEIKVGRDSLSELQVQWALARDKAGGFCYVIYAYGKERYVLRRANGSVEVKFSRLDDLVDTLVISSFKRRRGSC